MEVKKSKKQELTAIISSLELIEVRGSQNLNLLLGCIQHLQALLAQLDDE